MYKQIAKTTQYQKYITAQREQKKLYSEEQTKHIQHILLADLIINDILNQEIIQERMKKRK